MEKLPSLSGLRALSIIFVLLGHFTHKGYLILKFPLSFFADSQLGVNIFFVISGFLITRILITQEANGTISLVNFYKRRSLRIFPAYYFLLIVYALLQLLNIFHFNTLSWLSSILYFKYFAITDWETAHFWSLSIEEQFYLLWPFIFINFKKHRIHISIFILCCTPLIRYFAYLNYFNFRFLTESTSMFHRMDAIMTGCLLALTFDKWESVLTLVKSKLSDKIKVTYVIILFIFLIPSHFFILNVFHFNIDFILIPFGTRYGSISNILIAFLIVESIQHNDSFWFKTLNSKLFVYLGSISYSLYLWQQMFFSEKLKCYSNFPLNIFLIFVLANISYYFIEKPFLKFKNK